MTKYAPNRKPAPLTFDRSKNYGENLAHAINEFWKRDVAHADGAMNAKIPESRYGVPHAVATSKLVMHPAVVRVARNGSKWMVIK